MTEKITLEQALKLVGFMRNLNGDWKVLTVYGDVGEVRGNVYGDVRGTVTGDVHGDVGEVRSNVLGDVRGDVWGTINGRPWQPVETPQERLERLIQESGDQELIKEFKQLHQNN